MPSGANTRTYAWVTDAPQFWHSGRPHRLRLSLSHKFSVRSAVGVLGRFSRTEMGAASRCTILYRVRLGCSIQNRGSVIDNCTVAQTRRWRVRTRIVSRALLRAVGTGIRLGHRSNGRLLDLQRFADESGGLPIPPPSANDGIIARQVHDHVRPIWPGRPVPVCRAWPRRPSGM